MNRELFRECFALALQLGLALMPDCWLHEAVLQGHGSGYQGADREMVLYSIIVRAQLFLPCSPNLTQLLWQKAGFLDSFPCGYLS